MQSRPVKLLERSLYSTNHVFVKNSFQSGFISDLEYDILTEWFDYLIRLPTAPVNLFVYLQTSPHVCLDRVRRRARKEETSISLNFLSDLHDLHEDMLVQRAGDILPAPVLVLEANKEPREMSKLYTDLKTQILNGCT